MLVGAEATGDDGSGPSSHPLSKLRVLLLLYHAAASKFSRPDDRVELNYHTSRPWTSSFKASEGTQSHQRHSLVVGRALAFLNMRKKNPRWEIRWEIRGEVMI